MEGENAGSAWGNFLYLCRGVPLRVLIPHLHSQLSMIHYPLPPLTPNAFPANILLCIGCGRCLACGSERVTVPRPGQRGPAVGWKRVCGEGREVRPGARGTIPPSGPASVGLLE